MKDLGKQAEALAPGTTFVTLTKSLPSSCFKILHSKQYQMSWGNATALVQERIATPVVTTTTTTTTTAKPTTETTTATTTSTSMTKAIETNSS
jgi:hypothetical protein